MKLIRACGGTGPALDKDEDSLHKLPGIRKLVSAMLGIWVAVNWAGCGSGPSDCKLEPGEYQRTVQLVSGDCPEGQLVDVVTLPGLATEDPSECEGEPLVTEDGCYGTFQLDCTSRDKTTGAVVAFMEADGEFEFVEPHSEVKVVFDAQFFHASGEPWCNSVVEMTLTKQ